MVWSELNATFGLKVVEIELQQDKSILLDNAGSFKAFKLKIEDLFRFSRHHYLHVKYLAHSAEDVLPVVR